MVTAAEVYLWKHLVGAIVWDERQQLSRFEYAASFFDKGWDIAPLLMPLRNGQRVYSFPELRKPKDAVIDTFKGLPGLLADALPDRYGHHLMNVWLARQGRPSDSMNPVEQLCFIGARGMGALEFVPSSIKASKESSVLEIGSLIDVAHKMLANREAFQTEIKHSQEQAIKDVLKIGTSAGGARPKAVVAYNPNTGVLRSGQADAPAGFEHWLLKLDGVSEAQFGDSLGWGRVEYAYHLMAVDCGIIMEECRLLEENGRAHFMTKRFDREGSATKHHIQTLCAMKHFDYNNLYAYSYEQVFQTMREMRLTYPEAEQMFRRMVFNVLATNCDDHTKNFSFRLKQGGKWELSPAYDVCYSYDPKNIWVNQQTLSVNGKHRDITKADLMSIAKDNHIKKAEQIIADINAVVKNWSDYAAQVGVEDRLRNTIQEHLRAI